MKRAAGELVVIFVGVTAAFIVEGLTAASRQAALLEAWIRTGEPPSE